jgi:hypothetical protein
LRHSSLPKLALSSGFSVFLPSLTRLTIKVYKNVIERVEPFGPELLSSRLLLKNVKIAIYRTIILTVVLYEYETWYLTLK